MLHRGKCIFICFRDQIAQIKMGEEEKTKVYSAYCTVSGTNACVNWEKLESLPSKCPIVLHQKTPIRVLHRRSLATRERSIFRIEVCKAETKNPKAFVLNMVTQAGTYVKEFVHGDFGRTTPSLRELLGTDADILALDVLVRFILSLGFFKSKISTFKNISILEPCIMLITYHIHFFFHQDIELDWPPEINYEGQEEDIKCPLWLKWYQTFIIDLWLNVIKLINLYLSAFVTMGVYSCC